MSVLYDVAVSAVAAIMAGNEFAVAAFVHPQLDRLPDKTHSQIAPRLARVLNKVRPFWYALALLLMLGAIYEHRPATDGPGRLITFAAILWTAIIVFSGLTLLPISQRIATMKPGQLHPRWFQDRARWNSLHEIRVVLLILAVLFLLTGLFEAASTPAANDASPCPSCPATSPSTSSSHP
jgi:hypothetical protein